MRKKFNGLQKSLSAITKTLIVVAVILLASITVYYFATPSNGSQTSFSSTTTDSQVVASNEEPFIISFTPSTLIIAPNLTESYAVLNIVPLQQIQNTSLSLSATSEPGFEISISKHSVPYYPSMTTSIPINVSAGPGINPGNYSATVTAQFGSTIVEGNISIQVVQALVVMNHESYYPRTITVNSGTTVVWMNIDTPIGCCDPGFHTATFQMPNGSLVVGMASPILRRFDTWGFEFTQAGIYHYYCTIHPSMLGIVNVTA